MSDKICFMLSEEMNQIEGFQKLVNGEKLSLLIAHSNYFMNICDGRIKLEAEMK